MRSNEEMEKIESIKEYLIKVIKNTQDLELLRSLTEIIESESSRKKGELTYDDPAISLVKEIEGVSQYAGRLSREDIENDLLESRRQYEKGEYISIEDLEKEAERWE